MEPFVHAGIPNLDFYIVIVVTPFSSWLVIMFKIYFMKEIVMTLPSFVHVLNLKKVGSCDRAGRAFKKFDTHAIFSPNLGDPGSV